MDRRIINDKYSKREELNNNTQSVSLQWPRPELAPPSPEEEREKSEIANRIAREKEIRRRFGTMSHEKILQLFGMKQEILSKYDI